MFNEIPDHPDLLAFAAICGEAAQRHGGDWEAIGNHIKTRIDALPKDQRERLAMEIDRVLRYCPPDRGAATQ